MEQVDRFFKRNGYRKLDLDSPKTAKREKGLLNSLKNTMSVHHMGADGTLFFGLPGSDATDPGLVLRIYFTKPADRKKLVPKHLEMHSETVKLINEIKSARGLDYRLLSGVFPEQKNLNPILRAIGKLLTSGIADKKEKPSLSQQLPLGRSVFVVYQNIPRSKLSKEERDLIDAFAPRHTIIDMNRRN